MLQLITRLMIIVLAGTLAAAQNAPQVPSTPRRVSDFRTVSVINTNANLILADKVTAELKKSDRWQVVDESANPDLLFILSERRETATVDSRVMFESYAYTMWPSFVNSDTVTLTVVDRAADRRLLAVSCARNHFPSASRALVSRMRKKLAKLEKSGR